MSLEDELFESRLGRARAMEAAGQLPYGSRFDFTHTVPDILKTYGDTPAEGLAADAKFKVAGRLMTIRRMGKAGFAHLAQGGEKLQLYMKKDALPEADYELFGMLDLGDIVGAEGYLFRTRTGELSLHVERLRFLSKILLTLPEKYHGLEDVETRYRQRYLDLATTPESRDVFVKRAKIISSLRRQLDARGFIEVETPMMQPLYGGASARPFVTHHNTLDLQLYMRIAPELYLKRLLVGGMERVYEVGRVYRNEGISRKHNPEFTMLEAYQAYGDYHSMMDLTEALIVGAIEALDKNYHRPWGELTVDFTPPWPRRAYADLVREYAGVDTTDHAAVIERASFLDIPTAHRDHDVIVSDLFEATVEDALTGPIFVIDYPAAICPLTKRKASDPDVAERFELFVHGMELANAYTELNDPDLQESLFRGQLAGQKAEDSMAVMDEDFVRALRHAMPPAGGLGVGIDRLCMLLLNKPSIRDVILFPLLRPQAGG